MARHEQLAFSLIVISEILRDAWIARATILNNFASANNPPLFAKSGGLDHGTDERGMAAKIGRRAWHEGHVAQLLPIPKSGG